MTIIGDTNRGVKVSTYSVWTIHRLSQETSLRYASKYQSLFSISCLSVLVRVSKTYELKWLNFVLKDNKY